MAEDAFRRAQDMLVAISQSKDLPGLGGRETP